VPELDLEHYGWSEKDLTKEFNLGPGILPRFLEAGIEKMTLGDIIQSLKKMYCECSLERDFGKERVLIRG
jgi:2-oxoglutarate dehydrogenase E1 component